MIEPTFVERHFANGVSKEHTYSVDGVLHRDDGPSFISFHNGVKILEQYNNHGVTHREDGPANINYHHYDGSIWSELYVVNGVHHREDGPAYIRYEKDGLHEYYWINGFLAFFRFLLFSFNFNFSRRISVVF